MKILQSQRNSNTFQQPTSRFKKKKITLLTYVKTFIFKGEFLFIKYPLGSHFVFISYSEQRVTFFNYDKLSLGGDN